MITQCTDPEITARILEYSETHPNAAAVSEGKDALTYQQLAADMLEVSSLLQEVLGESPRVVVVMTDRAIDTIVCMLGALHAGHYYLPLDDGTPDSRIGQVLSMTGAAGLLSNPKRIRQLLSHEVEVLPAEPPRSLSRGATRTTITLAVARSMTFPSGLEGAGCVICTSGSTTLPKFVVIAAAAVANHVRAYREMLDVSTGDTIPVVSSLAFSLSITPIFLGLASGAKLVFPPSDAARDVRSLASLAADRHSTVIKLIPSLLKRFLLMAQANLLSFDHLRAIVLSGEPVEPELINSWRALYPKTRIVISYGCTEAFATSAHEVVDEVARTVSPFAPLGRAQPNIKVFVRTESGEPAQPETIGTICVTGANLFLGYLDAGALLRPRLVPLQDGAQLRMVYCTGDKGVMSEDGMLLYVGRTDQTLKVNGYRIQSEEVETSLRQVPGVTNAVVRKECKDGRERLVCLLEGNQSAIDVRAIRRIVEQRLPAYMVPRGYYWVEDIPRLPSGKVDRQRAEGISGVPLSLVRPLRTPRTALERSILCIWQSILRIDEIGMEDDFYDLGGDSLGFLDMLLELEGSLGIQVFTCAISGRLTIRSLSAGLIPRSESDQEPTQSAATVLRLEKTVARPLDWDWRGHSTIRECKAGPEYALTYSQETSLNRRDSGRSYFTFVRIQFRKPVDIKALFLTIAHLVQRHEMLRTVLDPDRRTQRPLDLVADFAVPSFDLSGDRYTDLNTFISRLFGMPYNLSTWPLFRVALFTLDDRTELVWQLSHMIVDLFGIHTLSEELIILYEHYARGTPLKRLPIPLRNQAYVSELQRLTYPDDLVGREHDRISEYQRCLAATKELARLRDVREPGAGHEMVLDLFLRQESDVYLLLACYARALSDWLQVRAIPIRVGTPGRNYEQFDRTYLRLVTKGNDHMTMVVSRHPHDTVEGLKGALRNLLEERRRDSLNFDKILSRFDRGTLIETAGMFSFGPLGNFTTTSNPDRSICSVPRPLWGIGSFGPATTAELKVGLFTFREGPNTRVHLHAKGVRTTAFAELEDLLTVQCRLSGLAS